MGNSEGSLSRKGSKHGNDDIDRRSSGSHKGTPKKKGIMKESLSRTNIYEHERSPNAKQNSPIHSQQHEQSVVFGNSKESSPYKTETSNKTNKNKTRNEEKTNLVKSTDMKKSNDSEEEKELHERSRSPRSPERSQTPKSYERSESPRSPMRNVDQSDQDSVSLSESDDDEDTKLRKHNNHLPSFIKPENKVLPTVVPVKPLHQTEFGAILQQGGSITRKKHQEQKEAELKRLEMLYEQTRLQDYAMQEQYWSMPNIPPADYDIPPPDYDDISDYEKDIKKSKKKSKSNQKDRSRNSFYSSPVRDQSEGQYAWDSETEWYIESKSEKKKKKEKENKGKKGISLIHRTESVNESLSPKKDKKKKSSKRSISLGPGESSLRDKWKNADWLRVKKKESKGFDENIASKKKNPIRKSNDVDTDEWRNPNNPYTTDVHHYNDEKQTAYYEKSFSKQSERGRHNNEYYKSENQKNVKSRSKRMPESETVESNIEKDNDHHWRQKEEQNNPSHKNQTESDSDNYQKKSASGFSERIFLTRYSPQKVDAATSTTLDDIKHPPPRKKGRKKNVMQDENLDWSNSHHKRQSPTKHNKEETYEKKMSSDEEILQKQRFHQSSGDVRYSPEYKSKDFKLSRSSHDLYREEDNSIMTEVKQSFENVISEMNYGSNEKKQEVMFGSTQTAQTGPKKTEKISSAVKNLKERNEHLQEEKIKEIRARSPSPIEMHLRPTVPKREFKMPPNFSPNQTWKNFTAQTSDNEGQQNCSNEDIRENKIEKIVNPSVPARHSKAIVPRIEKETSSSSDGDIDLYQGFDKQYSSKNQNWTPDQDLLDDNEPEVKYQKPSPAAPSPQAHLSMPSSMFPSKQNYSRSPISRVSPRQEDSSDSSSKRNSISRIKESVKHVVGLKNKTTPTHHLDANWSLVKSNSSEDERDYREFSRNSEQREKYMFGEPTENKSRNVSSFSSNNGHIVYLPGYQRPASVDLFEKKTHRVARAYSFQSPERLEAKQRFVDHVSRQAEEREHQREVEKARIQKVEEEFRRQREKQQLREKFPLSRSDADVHQLSHDEAKRNYYNWNDTKYYKEMNTNISENRKKKTYGKNNENKSEITSSKYYRHDNFKNNDEEERRQWKSVDNLGYTSPLQNISPDNRVQSLWRERMRVKSPSPERGLKRSQSQRISQENDHQDSRKWTQGSERFLQRSHSQRLAEPRETLFGDNYSNNRYPSNHSKATNSYLGQTHQSNNPSYFYNKGNKVYRAQSEIAINRDYQKEKWFEDARGRDKQRNRASYTNDQQYRANDRPYDNTRYGGESQHYSSSKDEFGRYSNGKEFRRVMSTSASDLLSNNSRSTFWKRHQESRRADI